MDKNFPVVSSITRLVTSPNAGASVTFRVTFSQSVTGVDTADFALNTTGVTGAGVTSVTGTGTTRTVTVNTGSDSGTIRLDLVDNNTILSSSTGLVLGGLALGDGDFTTGQVYTIDKVPPTVLSIVRASPNSTAAVP